MLKSVSFGYENPVYENITIPSEKGITAIAGKSGCGKTTLLRTIAGLITPESGSVSSVGRVGMVFQEPRLLPWFTVERNLLSVLRSRKMPRREMDERIRQALCDVDLAGCAKKYPAELSGGMKMRVSIARALVYRSDILLLDEPFNGLDVGTKGSISGLLRRLAGNGLDMVFVSHIPEDILSLADRVYVLSGSPARVTDSFETHLAASREYNRKLRTELAERIKSCITSDFG